MDEDRSDEKARQAFRRAAPPVDTDSFCQAVLARGSAGGAGRDPAREAGQPAPEAGQPASEASRPAKAGRRLRRADRRLRLGWKIALAAVGAVVVAGAVVAAVTSSRATADESPLATLDWHSSTELQLRYLPDSSRWSETYNAMLTPAMSDAQRAAAVARGEKPGVRVEQCLYQNGAEFVQVRTVTDTGGPLPTGTTLQMSGGPAVLETGLSGSLALTAPDLAVEFLGAQPDAAGQMTTTTAGAAASAGAGGADSEPPEVVATAPEANEPIPYHDAIRLTWTTAGTRVAMLSNLPIDELRKVAESLVVGSTN
jgi:hypothetical protein